MKNNRILIVEDEMIIAMDIAARLTKFGYDVIDILSTGSEALELCEKEIPDLVLMDIMLEGEIDGIETATKIREKYSLPIVYLTASSDRSTLERAKKSNPFGYLLKPYEDKEIYSTIEMALNMRRMEKQLRESEERFRLLAEHAKDLLFRINLHPEPRFEYLSPSIEGLTGYSPENFYNDPELGRKIFHPSTFNFIENAKNGRMSFDKSYLVKWIKKSGDYIWLEIKITPIAGENGQVISIEGIGRDVSDRIALESEAKLNKAYLEKLFESSPEAIVLLNNEGKAIKVNREFEKIFGYTQTECEGRTMTELIAPFNLQNESKNLTSSVVLGERVNVETIRRTKSGKLINVSILGAPVEFDGGQVGVFGIYRDISYKKKYERDLLLAKEQSEKSDRLKSEFLAQISHEIRTPINSILSFTSLLKAEMEEKTPSELKDSYLIIENGGRRLIRTIDSILNMAQLQTGNYDIKNELIDISHAMAVLEKEFKKHADIKKIKFGINNRASNPIIFADEYVITQIFTNLIDNAIKYTARGEVSIEIYNDNEDLVVEIRDTGVGISPEYIPRLFQPFSQEESGYSRKYEGSGLGLALVKRYCNLLGASIDVESEKSKGTVFKIIFNYKY